MSPALVLIGPAGCGKSTVGPRVAGLLGTNFIDLDEVGERYYREVGWSLDRLAGVIAAHGRLRAELQWEHARAHAVTRVVAEHPGAVIALGAGHGSYALPAPRLAVRQALAGVEHVVYLRPSTDRDRSLDTLRRRCRESKGTDWVKDGHDFLAVWLDDPGLRGLATSLVTTAGETPEQTATKVAGLAALPGAPQPRNRYGSASASSRQS